MTCPKCDGQRIELRATGPAPCPACDGAGEVTTDHAWRLALRDLDALVLRADALAAEAHKLSERMRALPRREAKIIAPPRMLVGGLK